VRGARVAGGVSSGVGIENVKYLLATFDRRENFSRGCELVSPVHVRTNPSGILVTLDDPIDGYVYDKGGRSIDMLVLLPRHVGGEIYPNLRSPCHVHMCIPKMNGTWEDGPYEILDCGILTEAT